MALLLGSNITILVFTFPVMGSFILGEIIGCLVTRKIDCLQHRLTVLFVSGFLALSLFIGMIKVSWIIIVVISLFSIVSQICNNIKETEKRRIRLYLLKFGSSYGLTIGSVILYLFTEIQLFIIMAIFMFELSYYLTRGYTGSILMALKLFLSYFKCKNKAKIMFNINSLKAEVEGGERWNLIFMSNLNFSKTFRGSLSTLLCEPYHHLVLFWLVI